MEYLRKVFDSVNYLKLVEVLNSRGVRKMTRIIAQMYRGNGAFLQRTDSNKKRKELEYKHGL